MNYYEISEEDLGKQSKIPLLKLGESGEVYYEMALEMVKGIKKNNAIGKKTVYILPVGPIGQYPIFVRLVNSEKISLKNTWFINMDEYLNDDGSYIDEKSPLSFRGFMKRVVYDKIDQELVMPVSQRIFPNPDYPERITSLIKELGGVDICFGGIGINGHLAFNEAQEIGAEDFAQLHTRTISISDQTRVATAIGDLGGAIEAMPKKAVTIGMAEILQAKKIRIGVFREWHRAVVRKAAYGEISGNFPATLLQNHPDSLIYLNHNAAIKPF